MSVSENKEPTARRTMIKGIGKDAEALGVHREHLRLVLHGVRTSPKLLARYQALQQTKEQQ